MPKDELRHIYTFIFVHLHRNSIPIVPHSDAVVLLQLRYDQIFDLKIGKQTSDAKVPWEPRIKYEVIISMECQNPPSCKRPKRLLAVSTFQWTSPLQKVDGVAKFEIAIYILTSKCSLITATISMGTSQTPSRQVHD